MFNIERKNKRLQRLRGKRSDKQISIFIASVDAIRMEWEALRCLCFCSYVSQWAKKLKLSENQHIWIINKCVFSTLLSLVCPCCLNTHQDMLVVWNTDMLLLQFLTNLFMRSCIRIKVYRYKMCTTVFISWLSVCV